jgi:murein DD-endopeptidase MepM/ murein hydrolase activator NlpD
VYVHLHTDRFKLRVGQRVQVGERLGQPSCDGGLETTGTHLHLARKYNGEWMPAGGPPAYVLSDWEVLGEHRAYHGKLVERSSGRSLTACACVHNNQISRPR